MIYEPIRVVAGIVWKTDRYLAVQRPVGKHMAGWWEFPGGKVEVGESLNQALTRELYEELSITVLDCFPWRETVHHYPDMTVHLFFFWVSEFQGNPKPRENQAMAWVSPSQNELPFLEADCRIVNELARLHSPVDPSLTHDPCLVAEPIGE